MHDIEKIHELDVIELTEDLPQYGLKQGAQGAVLEVLDEPELAYVLEFVGEDGTSSRVAYAVRPDQLRKVTSGTSQDSSSENESNIKKPDAIEITVDEP